MKKLFISCPMKGRTEENIRASMEKMHKLAELILGEELEVIPSYIEDKPPENIQQSIWYLGESIKKLAEADVFIGVSLYDGCWPGCEVKATVAHMYGIRTIVIPEMMLIDLMPDAWDIYMHRWDNAEKTCPVEEEHNESNT